MEKLKLTLPLCFHSSYYNRPVCLERQAVKTVLVLQKHKLERSLLIMFAMSQTVNWFLLPTCILTQRLYEKSSFFSDLLWLIRLLRLIMNIHQAPLLTLTGRNHKMFLYCQVLHVIWCLFTFIYGLVSFFYWSIGYMPNWIMYDISCQLTKINASFLIHIARCFLFMGYCIIFLLLGGYVLSDGCNISV